MFNFVKIKTKFNGCIQIKFLGIPLLFKQLPTFIINIIEKRRNILLENKLKIIRSKKKKKFKVGFLVQEDAKWSYQVLYDYLKKSDSYDPIVYVTLMKNKSKYKKDNLEKMHKCYSFFKNNKMNVKFAYVNKKYLSLDSLGVDFVFYQQPWDLDEKQKPQNQKKVITCYTEYGFDLISWNNVYMEDFHRNLDYFFIQSDYIINHVKQFRKNINNMYNIGSIKLDSYYFAKKDRHIKPIIIYAPHHSFDNKSLQLATFQYNGKFILNLAKKYSDNFYWIFKPHPRFKENVIRNNIMSEKEINNYFSTWEKLGKIHTTANYIELFYNSDYMITDSCAFLAEYLPTEKPVLHLFNTDNFNELAKQIISSYYRITNINELKDTFNKVILINNDYKKEERLKKIPLIFDKKEMASIKVYKFFNKILGVKYEK